MQLFHRVRLIELDALDSEIEVSEGLLATASLDDIPPVITFNGAPFVFESLVEEPDPNPPPVDDVQPTNAGALSASIRLYRRPIEGEGDVATAGAPPFVIEMPLRTS